MKISDLITLGNMGCTLQQAALLLQAKEMQEAKQPAQQIAQNAQLPQALPAQQIAQNAQPAQAPAQPLQLAQYQPPNPATQPVQQQTFFPWAQPVQAPAQPQQQADPVGQAILQAIGGLQQTIQASNINGTQQPKGQTENEIMAMILNPGDNTPAK